MNRNLRLRIALLLVLSGISCWLGYLLSGAIADDGVIDRFDTERGEALAEIRAGSPVLRVLFLAVTLLAAFELMLVLVPLAGIFFLYRRRYLVAAVWIGNGIMVGTLNTSFKAHFDRERPPFKDHRVYEDNESFPSGHSSSSMAIFGLLAYLVAHSGLRPGRRWLLAGGIILMIFAIGFSRIFLGAHYFSDVLGGYLLGIACLGVSVAILEAARRPVEPVSVG